MSSISATQARHAFFNLPEVDDAVQLMMHGDFSTFASNACHADLSDAPATGRNTTSGFVFSGDAYDNEMG